MKRRCTTSDVVGSVWVSAALVGFEIRDAVLPISPLPGFINFVWPPPRAMGRRPVGLRKTSQLLVKLGLGLHASAYLFRRAAS